MSPCTFDDALPRALEQIRGTFAGIDFADVRFIRDMNGRVHLVLPDSADQAEVVAARPHLADALGAYSPGSETGLVRLSDTLFGGALMDEPFLVQDINGTLIRLIERRVVGQDWALAPGTEAGASVVHPPRVSFFSLKGGVGRSTALFLWGRELAAQGKRVLLLDLDLEAPGLGAQLLPDDARPEFGVVDWLAEDLVGSPMAEAMLVERMLVARSPLADPGYLYVAPATGKRTAQHPAGFIAKLARAYLDNDRGGGEDFAVRVRRLLETLERALEPDLVLIDSRAGLHETAAAAILHLDADVLLFATDQPTVWEGYRYLLAQLAQMAHIHPAGDDDWRLRLKMVYARASEKQGALEGFRSRAYQLWLDCLYDEQPAGGAEDAFSFAETDDAAPHYPLQILNDPRFEQFNPLEHLSTVGAAAIASSFGPFMAALDERVLGNEDLEAVDHAD
ncbi:KGGVGR-motif variant AAA ATPase [Thiorhodovibrio frisius]|uniref:CobQ/CobB/MinD/ParA nucleotide binding domain-containing protein n=1 Tax=Thiorhodovibrio frisius TaxID=631362 RepID=H8Z526_9GAMM|nr:CobQ/CobB/MinD/ParA nucleotide binding domain-containing protein [Thiorhodovibrio frisius]EIC20433.1 CobQ/CobB/MinD/ParA nucleotide binding domain-containing protein [Thiorhodovibrio frisius]WPL21176.1 Septum formation inhibitor-activating ATPase [Thiorhodovibrio frisius]